MRNLIAKTAVVALVAGLAACAGGGGGVLGSNTYAYVAAKTVSVGDGSMTVTPTKPWNRERRIFWEDVHAVEDWTQNGPLLDDVTFVTGLKDRKSLIRQDSRDAQQVPVFRSDMTAPEIASMLDSAYRVRGGAVDFQTLSLTPRVFLGAANGFQLDYQHLDSDEVWRKGRVVGAVINGRLYLIMIDAVRSHYYPAGLPDFEELVASARLAR
jgi:hypothetical protein